MSDTANTPDPSAFYRDDREGEYEVTVYVTATVYETVTADSPEAARAKVQAMIENNEVDIYGCDFDSADIRRCRKTPPMFCVTRPGSNVTSASRLEPGDEPRLPNEYETKAYKPGAGA